MSRFRKIIFAGLFCCQLFFISCKTKSQPSNKNIPAYTGNTDSILYQFKHAFGDTLPQPENYVNDYENVFTNTEEDSLNQLIHLFEKQTSIQIAVVTFDTVMVTRQNFDELSLQLGNAWGVGQKNKNNGILIGISVGYKRIRIQNGTGIEKILSDAATKTIIDSTIIPAYKKANYFEGTLNGLKTIFQKLNELLK